MTTAADLNVMTTIKRSDRLLPPVCSAAVIRALHLIRTESEVMGARGKVEMSELDGSTGSLLLLELLLELEAIHTHQLSEPQQEHNGNVKKDISSAFVCYR